MSGVLRDLAAVRRALGLRGALSLVLGAAAAFALAAAGAALAARLGLFRWMAWGPVALWAAAGLAAALLTRSLRRIGSGARGGLRETAALVERELALRRGAFVGLVDVGQGPPAGTSAGLAGSAARRMAARLPPGGGLGWVPRSAGVLARRLRARGALLAAALGAAAISFRVAGDAAASLVSPLRAWRAAAAARVQIAVSPRTVSPGEDVVVTVSAGTGRHPTLHVRAMGEPWRSIALDADEGGRAAHRLRNIRAPQFVYASAGDAVSDTLRVGVATPAFLTAFAVTARYPAYLERPAEELPVDAEPVGVPVATVLAVSGAASAPLAGARLAAQAGEVPLEVSGSSFAGEVIVRGSARWHLALTARQGGALAEPLPTLDVLAVPDSAPVVRVPVPGADTTAPLDLKPAVVVDARDDHGLARVEIVSWRVSRLGVSGDTAVDSLAGVAGADRLVQSLLLDLTRRRLLPGDTLRYYARAFDRAPVPHEGRSPAYAFRLRSLAELREAVRSGSDSLAREAAALAADQSALSRRTEDLAAQRSRPADPTPRTEAGEGDAADRRRQREATVPFEQAEGARRVAERQQELAARAEALRTELERLARAARDAGLTDPAWQQRLRELDELIRQAITPELARRLEELRRALERLDPVAVQEALRRLADEQQRLRQELERSAELFERAALEGVMQTYAETAEALHRAEERWAREVEQRRDSGAAAEDQRELRVEADSLERGLERLAERLHGRGDSATADALERLAHPVGQAEREMELASGAVSRGERREAGRRGEAAADSLRPVAQRLRERQQQMSAAWRAEVLRALDDALSETIALAGAEQRLAQQLRRGEGAADSRGRQSAMEQGIGQVVRRLQQAAGRNALVAPRLGASLGAAREQAARSRQALEGSLPNAGEAAERAQGAAQALTVAAFQMLRNRDQIAAAQSGSGFAEAVRRMAELAARQGEIGDQLGGLLPLLGSGQEAVLAQLRALAARQRALANELERLGGSGLPGRPEELAEEARRLADRVEAGRLDSETLVRQRRLLRRMLDAGRSLRGEDEETEPERTSETARERAVRAPQGGAPSGGGLRYPVPPWSALRRLSAAERAMVLDYFRRLNAATR